VANVRCQPVGQRCLEQCTGGRRPAPRATCVEPLHLAVRARRVWRAPPRRMPVRSPRGWTSRRPSVRSTGRERAVGGAEWYTACVSVAALRVREGATRVVAAQPRSRAQVAGTRGQPRSPTGARARTATHPRRPARRPPGTPPIPRRSLSWVRCSMGSPALAMRTRISGGPFEAAADACRTGSIS
jgi:hypothetical protein